MHDTLAEIGLAHIHSAAFAMLNVLPGGEFAPL